MVSALETIISETAFNVCFQCQLAPLHLGIDATASAAATVADVLTAVQGWGWDLPVEERWEAVGVFMKWASGGVGTLRRQSEAHVEEARQDVAAASALAFKHAKIIGATVVVGRCKLKPVLKAPAFISA